MQLGGLRDRPMSTAHPNQLNTLESVFMDLVLRAFVKGLLDPSVRKEVARGIAAPDRCLKMVYTLAEEARRTDLEVKKLLAEER